LAHLEVDRPAGQLNRSQAYSRPFHFLKEVVMHLVNDPLSAANFPSMSMMIDAHAALRDVLDRSADIHDFQGRADEFLRAVQIVVNGAHRLYQMQHKAIVQ
jgi:hypothetical protein